MAIEDLMQLKYIVRRKRNSIKALMNNTEDISIAGNFLLITVLRSCLLFNKLFDTGTRCYDSLNSIRTFSTLDLCNLN